MSASRIPTTLPTVVILGRPNVGKSTLFNRLYGSKRALVHDMPGVTRDRLKLETEWGYGKDDIALQVVDTGGLEGERFKDEIENQVRIALETADFMIFVFDGKEGIHPDDKEILLKLKRVGILDRIPIIGAVNKLDHDSHEERIYDFYSAGIATLIGISAEHGLGIGDLKELVLDSLKERGLITVTETKDSASPSDDEPESETETEPKLQTETETDTPDPSSAFYSDQDVLPEEPIRIPRIAIVGRPNVGKSTLTNALLGEDRMIISPIAGTTTDRVDSEITLEDGSKLLLIDTAGIRRKNKTEKGVEVLSVVQTKKALDEADLALLILDGEVGISDQDEKVGGMIEDAGCSVILVMNKWDTQRSTGFSQEEARERIFKQMGFLRFAPIVFVSGKQKTGFEHLGELILDVLEQKRTRLATSELTRWLREESEIHNPMNAKFYLCHQTGRHPPSFTAYVSDPDKVHFSLKRHVVNAMRAKWGYMGTPIRFHFHKAKNQSELRKER